VATTRRRTRKPWYADRTTGDLLILVIASTVCFSVLASGMALFIVTLLYPEEDTSQGFHAVSDVINTLIGLLAGFLAGRTDATLGKQKLEAIERAHVPVDQ
jgi:hypothetical protein